MLIRKIASDLKAIYKSSQEALPDEEFCQACAATALKFCIGLYGKPLDLQIPYKLRPGITTSGSSCGYALGGYSIFISPHLKTREALCADIGHEMYHRVTMRRPGLHCQPWVNEMMAFVTSQWFLRSQGFQDYEKTVRDYYGHGSRPGKVNVEALRKVHYSTLHLPLRTLWQQYPENFYADVARLGIALTRAVNADDVPLILKAKTLEEWIASLPQEDQYAACRTLELPTTDKPVPHDKRLLERLFYALYRKGEREGAVEEFQKIIGLQPANGAAFYFLGRAYLDLHQYEASIEAFSRAASLNFQDKWLPQFSGHAYQGLNDFASAIRCFEEAAQGDPEWASAHYHWGESLHKNGDTDGARIIWQKVLTLGDDKFRARAQKSLETNPTSYNTTCKAT